MDFVEVLLGKPSTEKNVYFRALPKSPKLPTPSSPHFGQLGPFFGPQKLLFPRMTGKISHDDNYGCNDNYDDAGNFDENDVKNYQKFTIIVSFH